MPSGTPRLSGRLEGVMDPMNRAGSLPKIYSILLSPKIFNAEIPYYLHLDLKDVDVKIL